MKKMKIEPNKRESLANKYSISKLKEVLERYKPRKNLMGKKNGMFKSGNGEKYIRLRIDGEKVRHSHIVWRVNTKKKIPKGFNIHHKDENKHNDKFENLELVEAKNHGKLNLKGVKNVNSKL